MSKADYSRPLPHTGRLSAAVDRAQWLGYLANVISARSEVARMVRTRNRLVASASLAAAVALSTVAAEAALYKWVDANGRTVYSDQVPPGVSAEPVGGAPPAANPAAARELANRDAEFKKRQADRAEDAKKADKARADNTKLAALCQQARAQIVGLRAENTVIYRLNDKGERVVLDEAGRKAEIGRVELLMRERNCPPG